MDDGSKVKVMLEDGWIFEGDVLVGVDGICFSVRIKLLGEIVIVYFDYICYMGIVDFVFVDIEIVGYCVFFGYK